MRCWRQHGRGGGGEQRDDGEPEIKSLSLKTGSNNHKKRCHQDEENRDGVLG